MGLFNRKKKVVGLDIGDHSIKLAELKKTGSGYELVNYAVLPTPREAKVGETMSDPLALAPALDNLIEMYQGKIPKAAIALEGNSVLIRHFTLPDMPDQEMVEAVKFEVEANMPIPLAQLVVDFIRVGEADEGSGKKVEVMVVAARKDILNKFVEAVSTTGLEPVIVDIEPLALLRTLKLNQDVDNLGNFAIVNIGSTSTNISVFENTVLRFTRTVALGGNRVSGILSERIGISHQQAAAAKEDIDLNISKEIDSLNEDDRTELIMPVLSSLFLEINRTIEYYQAKFRGTSIGKVFFCGGMASIKGLADVAYRQLGMEAFIINPINDLTISSKLAAQKNKIEAAGTAMAVAVGLALSEVN